MSDDGEDVQQMPVRFPRSVHAALRLAAFREHASMNAIVVEAVREKLRMETAEEETK